MSFDVAVWEGPRPADEVQTQAEFARRCDAAYARVEAGLAPAQVTPRLRAFIADARRYYPDGDRDVDRVWADGRLSEGVDGDFLHTVLSREGLERALDVLAGLAGKHGLVFFDPLTGAVLDRPVPGPPVRRPPQPGVGTLQRFLLDELAPVGFAPVKGGLRLDLPDDVRVMLTPFVSTERGVRVAGASIAVYREADWQGYLRWFAGEGGTLYDPEAKFLGGYGNVLDFGVMFTPGELLERPHQRRWRVRPWRVLSSSGFCPLWRGWRRGYPIVVWVCATGPSWVFAVGSGWQTGRCVLGLRAGRFSGRSGRVGCGVTSDVQSLINSQEVVWRTRTIS